MQAERPKKPYRRLNSDGIRARYETIHAGLVAGKAPKLISEESGYLYGRVREVIHNDPALLALYTANRKSPVKLPAVGAVVPVIRQQSDGFQEWLVRSVPDGSTLADFMVSIAVDSFMDDCEEDESETESEKT